MPSIIARYYQGILQQVRSEVDLIKTLFLHQGVKGEGNETVLRDLLKRFIPKRYGVGTGVVIDRDGNQSNQCDIVIYDTFQYPSLLALTSVHLFPVDLVYAVIEVKTTLNFKSAMEALSNISSVRSLKFIPDEFGAFYTRGRGGGGDTFAPKPPLGIIFAYNSDAKQFKTFKDWFMPQKPETIFKWPTLVGCLDQGLLHFDAGAGLVAQPDPETPFKGLLVALQDEQGKFRKASAKDEEVVYGGIKYPVKRYRNTSYPIDQGRVLLLFLLYLQELLVLRLINPSISFREQFLGKEGIENGFNV